MCEGDVPIGREALVAQTRSAKKDARGTRGNTVPVATPFRMSSTGISREEYSFASCVHITSRQQANAHWSIFSFMTSVRNISGAAYSGVPRIVEVTLSLSRDAPKSPSFGL